MDATTTKFIELKWKPGSEDPKESGAVKIVSWPSVQDGSDVTVLAMFQ